MPTTSAELHEFATSLAVALSDETSLRASVSRAYYAAFHSSLSFVESLPRSAKCPPTVHHVTHAEMVERLKEWKTGSIHPELSTWTASKGQLWRAIESSRALRVKADYRLTASITLAEAQTALARTGLVMRHMGQIHDLLAAEGAADAAVNGNVA